MIVFIILIALVLITSVETIKRIKEYVNEERFGITSRFNRTDDLKYK